MSIVAWLRRDPIPNVHIANLSRPKEAVSDEFFEISDDDINLVNNEMVDLSPDLIKVTNVANLPYNTACIIYSIDNVLSIATANCSGSVRSNCVYLEGGQPLVLSFL